MITDQQLVINNLGDKLKAFTEVVSGDVTNETDFILGNTGIPTDTFNIIVSKNRRIQNISKLRRGLEQFYQTKFPFSVWLDANHLDNDWTSLLHTYGLNEVERNVMMKLHHTLHVNQVSSDQLTITKVKTREDLSKYTEVFMSLFEGSIEHQALETYFSQFSQEKLHSGVHMFIGFIDDMAISTGLLINGRDSYGIYDVMTKEDFRGKGLGSEMVQFLLSQTDNKEKPVVLQASDDGKNIYKRFGFINVGEMVIFE